MQSSPQLNGGCTGRIGKRQNKGYQSNKAKIDALPADVREANRLYAVKYIRIFKDNVIACVHHSGSSMLGFFRMAAKHGVIVSRQGFLNDQIKFIPNFLYICTFSRIVGVDVALLFNPDLPNMLEAGTVQVNLIEQPEVKKPAKKKAA